MPVSVAATPLDTVDRVARTDDDPLETIVPVIVAPPNADGVAGPPLLQAIDQAAHATTKTEQRCRRCSLRIM